MTRNPIRVALFAAILAACGSVPANTGATSSEDAGNNNRETAVANDAPSPPPDVVSNDAGPATPDAQVVADARTPEDVQSIEDRATPPADGGMALPFSNEACTRLRTSCWRIQGSSEPCEQIPCRMIAGNLARVTVPPNMFVRMGYPNATCAGHTCRLESIMNVPSECYWVDLSETMSGFRCICPGQPDINVELGR